MKKLLLVIANYKDWRQNFFEDFISKRNKDYCHLHNFEYFEIKEGLQPIRNNMGWIKAFKVKEIINNLNENDILTCLDADMIIHKLEYDYTTNKSFSYAIDSGNTHCMGSYSIKVNDWTKKLFDLITSEERYQKLGNKLTIHPAFNSYSSFWESHYDQASWYSLAGILRHSWISFWDIPNTGWHSDKNNDTIFSLEELYKHVEILSTEWNVTEIEGESDCNFNINKVKKQDVIIRHFAGKQPWRKEWLI